MPSEYDIGVFKFAVADPNELALYGGAILGAFLLLAVVFYFRVGTRPKRKCDCCGENCGCGDNCSCGKTSDSKEISNAATSSAEVSTGQNTVHPHATSITTNFTILEKRCEACGADCTCGTTCDCGKESKRGRDAFYGHLLF